MQILINYFWNKIIITILYFGFLLNFVSFYQLSSLNWVQKNPFIKKSLFQGQTIFKAKGHRAFWAFLSKANWLATIEGIKNEAIAKSHVEWRLKTLNFWPNKFCQKPTVPGCWELPSAKWEQPAGQLGRNWPKLLTKEETFEDVCVWKTWKIKMDGLWQFLFGQTGNIHVFQFRQLMNALKIYFYFFIEIIFIFKLNF